MKSNRTYKMKDVSDEEGKSDDKIRPVPLYAALICGIIIFIVGLYMFFAGDRKSTRLNSSHRH